jgi:hypothetical protein
MKPVRRQLLHCAKIPTQIFRYYQLALNHGVLQRPEISTARPLRSKCPASEAGRHQHD